MTMQIDVLIMISYQYIIYQNVFKKHLINEIQLIIS